MHNIYCNCCGECAFVTKAEVNNIEEDTGFIHTEDGQWICRNCINELYLRFSDRLMGKEIEDAKNL